MTKAKEKDLDGLHIIAKRRNGRHLEIIVGKFDKDVEIGRKSYLVAKDGAESEKETLELAGKEGEGAFKKLVRSAAARVFGSKKKEQAS